MCGCTTGCADYSESVRIPGVSGVRGEPDYTLPRPSLATTGAFYFFNQAQSIKNALQYLAPSPTFTANLEPLFPPK